MEVPREFMTAMYLWGGLVIALPFYRGLRHKKWKLGFKESLATIINIGGLLWIMFFVVTSVALLPPFIGFLETVPLSESSKWILDIIPYFYVFTILGISGLVAGKLFGWKPKCTEEEKEFLREERRKWRGYLGPLGKLVKVEEKK